MTGSLDESHPRPATINKSRTANPNRSKSIPSLFNFIMSLFGSVEFVGVCKRSFGPVVPTRGSFWDRQLCVFGFGGGTRRGFHSGGDVESRTCATDTDVLNRGAVFGRGSSAAPFWKFHVVLLVYFEPVNP